MTNAVTKREDRETLEAILKRPAYSDRFKQVLGDKASQFCSSLVSIGRTMPDVEPKSVIGSAMVAACLDLPIEKNLGFAWIVPYKSGGQKFAQFQMGYKGFIQLALRTGYYAGMNASAINKEAYGGRDAIGEPIIDWEKVDETKPAIGYVFAFKMVNGFSKICFWSKEKVLAHAQRYSQSFRSGNDSPWKTHPDRMAIKTVIANELSDWGILSVQFQLARKADQGVVKDVDAEVEYLDNEKDDPKLEDKGPEPTDLQKAKGSAKTTQDKPKEEKGTSTPAAAETQRAEPPAHGDMPSEQTPAPTGPATAAPPPKPETTAQTTPEDDNVVFEQIPAPGGGEQQPGFVPNPQETAELQAVRRLLHSHNKTEADLISVLRKNKAMKDEQTKLGELSSKKLENISTHWDGLMKLMAQP